MFSHDELKPIKRDGFGAPTKYRDTFCEMVEEHMTEGYSFESFAGRIGVSVDTLYEWAKKHRDFSEAKKRGVAQSLLYWEQLGKKGMRYGPAHFNSAVYIYTMKCRFRKFGYLTTDGMADDDDGFEFDYE